MIDYCTEAGAADLAERIREYWRAQGESPTVWVERMGRGPSQRVFFDVRSDMVNGKPRSGGAEA